MSNIRFGINIIGAASANVGIGTTIREFIHALLARGETVSILDVNTGEGRSKFDNRFQHLMVDRAEDLPYEVNLFIFGALSLPDYALFPPKGLQSDRRLNVAMAWWELSDIPRHWSHAGRIFDVLVAGSDFVRSTFATHIPGVPVLLAPHPIQIPEQVRADRSLFGLPEDAFLVYTGFEPASDPARKNPFAAIEAFKRAYPKDARCHLVIKVNNPNVAGKALVLLERMYASTRSDPRIHLIRESLPYDQLLSLYASCDVFVSLHRSEGLGLVPLEAMRLGKPVVATGWSGNMSYMNYRNACLVGYEFVGTSDSFLYGPENLGIMGFWAEPDIDQAASWLRKLASDPQFRTSIGHQAAVDTMRYQQHAMKMEFVDELKAIWENINLVSRRDKQLLRRIALNSLQEYQWRDLNPLTRFYKRTHHKIKEELDRRIMWRWRNRLD